MAEEIFKDTILVFSASVLYIFAFFFKRGILFLCEWLKAKTSKTVYENALIFAQGIYSMLEDQWRVSGMGERKRQEMNRILKKRFPSLTTDELDAINKAICFEMKSAFQELSQETAGQ